MKPSFAAVCLFWLQGLLAIANGQSHWYLEIQVKEGQSLPRAISRFSGRQFDDSLQMVKMPSLVIQRLNAQGYIEASVDQLHWDQDTLILLVHTGKPYSIGNLRYEAPPEWLPLLKQKRVAKKVRVTGVIRESLADPWLKTMEDNGHPFAVLHPDSLVVANNKIEGRMTLDPGPFILLDSVVNRSGFRISHKVLQRIVGISSGDPFSQAKISAVDLRLKRSGFMSPARPSEPGFLTESAWLYVYPAKSTINRFDGWVGLSQGNQGNQLPSFMGAADLMLTNLVAQAEQWRLTWNRTQGASQHLNLGITLPFIAGSPFGSEVDFSIYKQDTSWLNTRLNLAVPYFFHPTHALKGVFQFHRSDLLSRDQPLGEGGVEPYAYWLSGLNWQLSTLTDRINPVGGLSMEIGALANFSATSDSSRPGRYLSNFNVEGYHLFLKKLVAALSLKGAWLYAAHLKDNELYRLGGYSSIRGFDEDQFRCSAYLTGSFEMRLLLNRDSYLLAFIDHGLMFKRSPLVDPSQATGFGIGTQIRTGGGLLRLLYGLGAQAGQKPSLSNGRIHLGYVGLF